MADASLFDPMKDLKASNFLLANRVKTFKNWFIKKGPCCGSKMAEAGFYKISPGCVKCFFCDKELDGWDAQDIPMQEHEAHSGDCPFVKYQKCKTEPMTIEDALRLLFQTTLYKQKSALRNRGIVLPEE